MKPTLVKALNIKNENITKIKIDWRIILGF